MEFLDPEMNVCVTSTVTELEKSDKVEVCRLMSAYTCKVPRNVCNRISQSYDFKTILLNLTSQICGVAKKSKHFKFE